MIATALIVCAVAWVARPFIEYRLNSRRMEREQVLSRKRHERIVARAREAADREARNLLEHLDRIRQGNVAFLQAQAAQQKAVLDHAHSLQNEDESWKQ